MAEEDQSMVLIKCPYCNGMVTVICPYCSEWVLERDRFKHSSSRCKALHPKHLVIYECPLCGKLLPEKNKIKHEFSCQKLFVNPSQSYSGVSVLGEAKVNDNEPVKAFAAEKEEQHGVDDATDEKKLNNEEKRNEVPVAKGVDRLVQNLKSLLLEGHNSDAVLKADHREFRVHKGILAARSAVFASMFQHDMAEKNSGVVDIPDCTADSFEVFLDYLYTGSTTNMSWDNVFNLYYAADKYQVDDLKEECVEFLTGSLSVDNFCDVIDLSLRHNESELQKAATRFFSENLKKIIKTVQWQKYMHDNSTEANELLIKALNA